MTCSNDRITRALGNDKSTSIAKHSRLKSSMTLNVRMLRPLAKLSDIKSIDQTSLIVVGTLSASGLSRLMRFLGLIRKFSSSSQRSEEHTSELQSRPHLVCRLLL